MTTRYVMQRDTNGWRLQVWVAFGVAILASAWGVLDLPNENMERAFFAIGLFFSVFSCFSVAKMQRDNRDGQVDTQGWIFTVWVAFAAAMALTTWGLWRMGIDPWHKRFLAVAWLFVVSTTFSLAKTIRDKHEAEMLEQAMQDERTEKPEASPA